MYKLSRGVLLCLLVLITICAYSDPTRIDFSGDTVEENGLTIQGAGFGSLPAADVRFGDVPTEPAFPGATDGRGAVIEADPGEGVMLFAQPIETARAALVRCSVYASHAETAITLASIDEGPDVFVATNSPNNAASFVGKYRRLVVFYSPPSQGFQPVLQVVNQSQTEPLTVYVDNFEIYTFGEGEYWSSDFLDGDENDPAMLYVNRSDLQVTPTPEPPMMTPTPPSIDPELVLEGQRLFENPHNDRGGNFFACTICHDKRIDGEEGIIKAGHTMFNVASRPYWKNGKATRLIDAVNACLSDWMNAPTLTEDDPEWKALDAYLHCLTPSLQSDPIEIQIVPPPDPLTGGDFERGKETFQQLGCIECHGTDLLGKPDGEGGLLGPFLAYRPQIPLDHDYISAKIRQSGANLSGLYDGLRVGGNMPFWGADRLSDNEVRDLAEYIATISRETAPPEGTPTPTPPQMQQTPTPMPPSAGIQPGWVAEFDEENAHSIGGKVWVKDEHTLQFEDFTYDGDGIDVALYLIDAAGENFTSAEGRAGTNIFSFTLGECYGPDASCNDGNFTVTLPDSVNLADYTHISVWCISVGTSFGDGKFMPALEMPEPIGFADFGTGNAHSVGGKVWALDEHTLQFEDFTYNGGGIDVALYLIKAAGDNFTSAEGRAGVDIFDFTLGECYGPDASCNSGNFTVTLPESINVSDYTHISVWCIAVGISFGDGRFEPPSSMPEPISVADFGTGNAHSVGGKVWVMDEHTLQFEDFTYDGGGIDVALYLIRSPNDNFTSAEGRGGVDVFDFTLGECYGLNDSCNSGNFTVTVPDSINLSEYSHVSVWCISVGISFGDGRFVVMS